MSEPNKTQKQDKPIEKKRWGWRWTCVYLTATLFFLINLLAIFFLYIFSGDLWREILKWLQFTSLLLPLFILMRKAGKYAATALAVIFYFFYFFLIGYSIITRTKLDFSFLKRNFADIDNILPHIMIPLLALFSLALISALFISAFYGKLVIKKDGRDIPVAILAIVLFSLLCSVRVDNELVVFAHSIYYDDDVIDYYQKEIYGPLLLKSADNKKKVAAELAKIDVEQLPDYLDNVIILHLESLSSFLVNETVTPNFVSSGREGVFFPKFYANGVQTILGYEAILCSLPPSFDMNLVQSGYDKKVVCLPEIFKNMGYRNYFFKGGVKLSSTKTDVFIANLKFDELHNEDIMRPDDEKYPWGYREDLFYERAFDYLKDNAEPKRNFIYVDVGATNHWPFPVPAGLENEVPYADPENFTEQYANTMYLQDGYFKTALEKINGLFPEKNYTLLALGDHAWPAGLHDGNTYNTKESFEENFMTSLVMILGEEPAYRGVIIDAKYSQMDIMPGLLDLVGIAHEDGEFRRSFMPELSGQAPLPQKTILIQPYAVKYINLVVNGFGERQYNDRKYQYNSRTHRLISYDLRDDPGETKGYPEAEGMQKSLSAIRDIFAKHNP